MTTTQQPRPAAETTAIVTERDRPTAYELDLAELTSTGLPGCAQALDLRETGHFVDEHPVLDVRLSVRVGGGPPYPAMYVGPIREPGLGRAQDGLSFAARVDPDRPDRVFVDWLGRA